jgi:hypothetical protein
MCVKTKRIIKSRDAVFIEGSKEIGGVLHPKKEENVIVHEEVEREEPLTFSQDTTLNEIRMEYWKQLEKKQEMKVSRFMKWNNCIN